MTQELILKKIEKLEFASGLIATLAPALALLIGFENRILILIIILGFGFALQPYIYLLHKKINQVDEFKRKKFWPMATAICFILFLVLESYYNWLF